MAWEAKVNRHVVVLATATGPAGTTNYVKRRPAIITGFASDSAPRLRVGHGSEVYGNASVGVVRRTDPDDNATGKYVTY